MFGEEERYKIYQQLLKQFFEREAQRVKEVIVKVIEDDRSQSPTLEPRLYGVNLRSLEETGKLMDQCIKLVDLIGLNIGAIRGYDPRRQSDAGKWTEDKIKVY